jgi:uncharacterized protein YgiM (DUF1202 family)
MKTLFMIMLTCNVLSATFARGANGRDGLNYSKRISGQAQPKLAVGGIYYVTATFLNLRKQPVAEGPIVQMFSKNTELKIINIYNKNWVLVSYTSEDVIVEGYVSKWYLFEKK